MAEFHFLLNKQIMPLNRVIYMRLLMQLPNDPNYLGESSPQLLDDGAVSGDVQGVDLLLLLLLPRRRRPLQVISGTTATLAEHFHIGNGALKVKTQTGQIAEGSRVSGGDVTSPDLDGRLTAKRGLRHHVDYRDCLAPQQSITAAPILRGKEGRKGRGGYNGDRAACAVLIKTWLFPVWRCKRLTYIIQLSYNSQNIYRPNIYDSMK